MLRVFALVGLLGCGVSDFFEDGVGTVYTCGDGKEEWCSRLSADDVSDLRGLECHATGFDDRWWPALTNLIGHGCDFSCTAHTGCNAHQGCLCPGNGAP